MIEYNGEKYNYKFTIVRIEQIEKELKKPVLVAFAENDGVLSLSDLKTFHIYGLRKEDDSYAGEKVAKSMFEEVLANIGYTSLLEEIVTAFQRDCPFFFPAD